MARRKIALFSQFCRMKRRHSLATHGGRLGNKPALQRCRHAPRPVSRQRTHSRENARLFRQIGAVARRPSGCALMSNPQQSVAKGGLQMPFPWPQLAACAPLLCHGCATFRFVPARSKGKYILVRLGTSWPWGRPVSGVVPKGYRNRVRVSCQDGVNHI